DAQVFATVNDADDPVDQVIDVDEGPALATGALDREADRARGLPAQVAHSQRELGDDVLMPHVGAVYVVRPEDHNPIEVNATEVDRHQFAGDLAPAVAIPGVRDVGDRQR